MDTDAELNDSWWEQVKYYARLAIERVEYGVNAVKELLSTLTSDERCGVILEFEDVDPQKFAQLVADAHSGLNGGAMRFCEVLKIRVLNHLFRAAIAAK